MADLGRFLPNHESMKAKLDMMAGALISRSRQDRILEEISSLEKRRTPRRSWVCCAETGEAAGRSAAAGSDSAPPRTRSGSNRATRRDADTSTRGASPWLRTRRSVQDKCAVITGAGGDIGRELSVRFA
jgi:hypothetical protein